MLTHSNKNFINHRSVNYTRKTWIVHPFGMEISQFSLGTGTNKYQYNGKEIQDDFNLYWYDYGGRFYDPQLGRWHSVDPLAEKYYSISPYAYVANNPIIFIDPDGREVIISGALSEDALRQLQERVKNRITLSKNEYGNLSYTINDGQKLKGVAKRMAGMIDDNSITVNIITTYKNETSTGDHMIGGAFMGNTVMTDANGITKIIANQEVNPSVLGSADAHTKTPGKMIMHEATEAYAGAQISQKKGVSVGPATQVDASNPQSVYSKAHRKATPQTPVFQTLYDKKGNVTTDVKQAVLVKWNVTSGGKSKVIQTYP